MTTKIFTWPVLIVGMLAILVVWLGLHRPVEVTSAGSADEVVDSDVLAGTGLIPSDPESGDWSDSAIPGSELIRANTNPRVPGTGVLLAVDVQRIIEGDIQEFMDALATDDDGYVHRSGFENALLRVPVVKSGAVVLDRIECSSIVCAARFLAFDENDFAILRAQWQDSDGPPRFAGVSKDLPQGPMIVRQMVFSVSPEVRGVHMARNPNRSRP